MNITVKPTIKSSKKLGLDGIQRSVRDAVQVSIPNDEKSFDLGTVEAKCMLLLLQALSREMISPDVWALSMMLAQRRAQDLGIECSEEAFQRLAKVILSERRGSVAGALDRAGFY